MNQLNNNMTKMVLLVLVAAVLLVGSQLKSQKDRKGSSFLGTLAVVLVAIFLGNNLMVAPVEEEEEVAAELVANNNAPVNNVPVNNNAQLMNNAPLDNNMPVEEEGNVVNAANYEDDVNVENVVEGFQNNPNNSNANANANANAQVDSHDMMNSRPEEVNPITEETTTTVASQEMSLTPKIFYHHQWPQLGYPQPRGIDGPNFLNPEHLVGINTVGQSLRNANRRALDLNHLTHRLRYHHGLQTTIEPDTNRKPLEIGECA